MQLHHSLSCICNFPCLRDQILCDSIETNRRASGKCAWSANQIGSKWFVGKGLIWNRWLWHRVIRWIGFCRLPVRTDPDRIVSSAIPWTERIEGREGASYMRNSSHPLEYAISFAYRKLSAVSRNPGCSTLVTQNWLDRELRIAVGRANFIVIAKRFTCRACLTFPPSLSHFAIYLWFPSLHAIYFNLLYLVLRMRI